jgi:hypothetical protein
MRKFIVVLGAWLMLSGAACSPPTSPAAAPSSRTPAAKPAPSELEHVESLIEAIADDMVAIANSFSGGPNDPHGPVSDPYTLKQDQARLAEATDNARALLLEMQKLQRGVTGGR